MYVLGVSAFYHNSSCCLFRDGELRFALQEERVSRKKGDASLPINAIRHVLTAEGLTIRDVDLLCYYEDPQEKLDRLLEQPLTDVQTVRAWKRFHAVETALREQIGYQGEIFYARHHQAHVANGIFQSTWDTGCFLSVDGVGERETTAWGTFDAQGMRTLGSLHYPHSMGLLYSTVTSFLGYSVNDEEFKVMGLAAHGEPRHISTLRAHFIERSGAGWQLKPTALDSVDALATALQLQPRQSGAPIETVHRDLAASLQQLLEEELIGLVQHAFPKGTQRLVFCGGVAHNSLANQKLSQLAGVSELFIPAAPNDTGSAIGASVLGLRSKNVRAQLSKRVPPFWGPALAPSMFGDLTELFKSYDLAQLARALADGTVVAVCRGRMEFGDRALGHRSILAHPSVEGIKDTLNRKVKKREDYRPFAPAVPLEDAARYFDMREANQLMSKTYPVRPECREQLRGIENVDGTARVQTVDPATDPWFYDLLKEVGATSGIPVLINTSLNLNGEPIVMTAAQALDAFLRTDIDWLVVDDRVLEKTDLPSTFLQTYRGNVKPPASAEHRSRYELL